MWALHGVCVVTEVWVVTADWCPAGAADRPAPLDHRAHGVHTDRCHDRDSHQHSHHDTRHAHTGCPGQSCLANPLTLCSLVKHAYIRFVFSHAYIS